MGGNCAKMIEDKLALGDHAAIEEYVVTEAKATVFQKVGDSQQC